MLRTRWAAIGAATAITLGAGGISLVAATTPEGAAAFVPIEPCRLFDTRPEFQVGARSTPIGDDETFTIVAHGDQGDCTGIPTTATGLGLNVTAVDPTLATVLTIWGDGDRPTASSLNPTPGSPPTPNAVTTGLTGAGELSVWNAFGEVHVLADVVGYYADHTHDDRYYTEDEVDAAFAEADDRYLPIASVAEVEFDDGGAQLVGPVEITAPSDGVVIVDVSCRLAVFGPLPDVNFAFGVATSTGSSGEGIAISSPGSGSATYEARRGYPLAEGETAEYSVSVVNGTDTFSHTCELVSTVQFVPDRP